MKPTPETIRLELEAQLGKLKDFQLASVDALYRRFGQGQNRLLLADEVGLGKTLVARGVIARLLADKVECGDWSPLRVTYVCSNQVLARENLKKLNPLPAHALVQPSDRLAFLARAQEKSGRLLQLRALTPGTSFQSWGGGNSDERALIYAALIQSGDRTLSRRAKGLRRLLRGGITKENFSQYEEQLISESEQPLRARVVARFIAALRRESIDPAGFSNDVPPGAAYGALLHLAKLHLDGRSFRRLKEARWRMLCLLRRHFIDACLPCLKADLYVLDEFQRFRDLLNPEDESDGSRIARYAFHRAGSRCLLLSATPFKAFTTKAEADRGEDHYRDFSRLLAFLIDDAEKLGAYEHHRRELREQLATVQAGVAEPPDPSHRQAIERILRPVICRTERSRVAGDAALVRDRILEGGLPINRGDVLNFAATDRLVAALERHGLGSGSPIEFCKSALAPLSFLHHYQIKERLRAHRAKLIADLRSNPAAWLDFSGFHHFEWNPDHDERGASNARLRSLIDLVFEKRGEALLWIPPSLPYWPLEDAFEGCEGFTKTLVFSSWVMVPRMIATLVSYEAERRTLGSPKLKESFGGETPVYFTKNREKLRPAPKLQFSKRREKLADMSLFTLRYPSISLAEAFRPLTNVTEQKSLQSLRSRLRDHFERRFRILGLSQHGRADGESQRWYWAAPLLLDQADPNLTQRAAEWVVDHDYTQASDEDDAKTKQLHEDHLHDVFLDPSVAGLSADPPADLFDVLADLALGSPAVLAFRTLERFFPSVPTDDLMDQAVAIADALISLFNKPTSIAAIHLSEEHAYFWRMVADYCASGCLQSVLDEFVHQLCSQLGTGGEIERARAVTGSVVSALTSTTASLDADDLESFQQDAPRKLRTHYAVEFGSQRVETSRGSKRVAGLRETFNSPFRPFVLATTSIGQEGLDFHSWCRRIVHWNLPGNPVDLEQREGRINRFRCHAIRQILAKRYRRSLVDDPHLDPWEALFETARNEETRNGNRCELVPSWHVDPAPDDPRIERVVPLYPFSSEQERFERLRRALALYRLAFGQPHQEELVQHLLRRDLSHGDVESITRSLVIDLTPEGCPSHESDRSGPI